MRRARLASTVAAAVLLFPLALAAAPAKYSYYLTGNAANVTPAAQRGYVLMGGGLDVDQAFQWMGTRAGGGDFVVIRVTGADGYNQYVYDLAGCDSVETLVIKNRAAASDPFVLSVVRNADALFIAGGDQSDYVNLWMGTPLENVIHDVAARAPVGGTSAGLAVLGEFVYSAQRTSTTSSEALANPFARSITLERDFLHLASLEGLITDSHFVERDRMGRLLAFLARIVAAGWAAEAHAIAVDSETALLVDERGTGTVVSNAGHATPYVYFLAGGTPETCVAGTPLTYRNVAVRRVGAGGTFDLDTWTGRDATAYSVTAEAGVLTGSGGTIY